MERGKSVDKQTKKAGAWPAFLVCPSCVRALYVVERGFTARAVAGTMEPLPEKVQPVSPPPAATGVQAGRLGLICSLSVSVGTSIKWTMLSPAVETKKYSLSGLKAPAKGAMGDVPPDCVVSGT